MIAVWRGHARLLSDADLEPLDGIGQMGRDNTIAILQGFTADEEFFDILIENRPDLFNTQCFEALLAIDTVDAVVAIECLEGQYRQSGLPRS